MTDLQKYEDPGTSVVPVSAMMALSKSEIESQLDAAHRYPRKISHFLAEAATLATLSESVAESCMFTLPRGKDPITGPSIRLAEICASAYGNLHVESRIVEDTGKEIVARGMAWDIEKNLKFAVETRRRITGRDGKRYNDDMVTMTGNAAASIAIRNAIFKVIPQSLVQQIYEKARAVSVGTAQTLGAKRAEVVQRLQKMGVPLDRIFVRVGGAKIEDVGLDELGMLIGLGTAIKTNELSIDEAFPPPDTGGENAKALEAKLASKSKSKPEAKAEAKPEPVKADADGVIKDEPKAERQPGED